MIGIYKISSPSGRVYIGQSRNLKKRFYDYSINRCQAQTKLYNSFKKYGFNQHTLYVIHELPNDVNQIVLNTYEQLYIEQYRSCGISLLNLKHAESNGKHSTETIEKMRLSKSNMSDETRNKMSIAAKKSMANGTREKVSASRTGKGLGNKSALGYKHTPEALEKISMAAKGRKIKPRTEEHQRKLTESIRMAKRKQNA